MQYQQTIKVSRIKSQSIKIKIKYFKQSAFVINYSSLAVRFGAKSSAPLSGHLYFTGKIINQTYTFVSWQAVLNSSSENQNWLQRLMTSSQGFWRITKKTGAAPANGILLQPKQSAFASIG
ncbi:hypothetical protein BMI76_01250 [Streptococcus sp. 'caviae']|nr:hypothetical protein BMI76_01250 [Streptococcus sp. 'caviae']